MEEYTSQTVDNSTLDAMKASLKAITRILERLNMKVGTVRGDLATIKGDMYTMSGRLERA